MRFLTFVAVASTLTSLACSRGSGSTSTMSTQPVVSVVGCVGQSKGAYVLTTSRSTAANGAVGTSGTTQPKQYRLLDDAHTGVDRYVDRQVQVTGKAEKPGAEENATLPTIRVTQLSSLGGC